MSSKISTLAPSITPSIPIPPPVSKASTSLAALWPSTTQPATGENTAARITNPRVNARVNAQGALGLLPLSPFAL